MKVIDMNVRFSFLVLLTVMLVACPSGFAWQNTQSDASANAKGEVAKDTAELEESYNKAELDAGLLAKRLREKQVSDEASNALRQKLREHVTLVFKLRQNLRRAEISAARARLDVVADELNRRDQGATQIIESRVVALLKCDDSTAVDSTSSDELARLLSKERLLKQKFGPNHPDLVALQRSIGFVRDQKAASDLRVVKQSPTQQMIAVVGDLKSEVVASLDKLEAEYREFRKNSPLILVAQENPIVQRSRKYLEEKTTVELEILSLSILSGQLKKLRNGNEKVSGTELLELRNKVKAIMGDKIVDEVGDPKLNHEAVELRLESLVRNLEALSMDLQVMDKEVVELREYELKDAELRRAIEQKQKLYEAIIDRFGDVDMTREKRQ